MYFSSSIIGLCALFFLGFAQAQSSASVPADLSSAFDPTSIQLLASYGNDAQQGFESGDRLTTQGTAKQPIFSLGQSSGVNNAIEFVIMMVDTTTTTRTLHYMQTDFKATGDETTISSSTQPIFAYKAPGTLGETGTRQYSFLLYQQKSNFQPSTLPTSGQTFDVASFEKNSGLSDALAGIVMNVDVSGTGSGAGAGTGEQNTPASVAPQTIETITTPIAAPTSEAEPTAAATTTTTSPTQAQTSVAGAASSTSVDVLTPTGSLATSSLSVSTRPVVGGNTKSISSVQTSVTSAALASNTATVNANSTLGSDAVLSKFKGPLPILLPIVAAALIFS